MCRANVLSVVSAICIIANSIEGTVPEFDRKTPNWKSFGVPHPKGPTLKRKRKDVDELGEELDYERYFYGLFRMSRGRFEWLYDTIKDDLEKDATNLSTYLQISKRVCQLILDKP